MTDDTSMRILIPATTSASTTELIHVGAALLSSHDAEATVLGVVEVPENRSLSEGALVARRRRSLLRRVSERYPEQQLSVSVRSSHSLAGGIRDGALATQADLLLLQWRPGRRTAAATAVEALALDPPCDVALVKQGTRTEIRSVLLPVRGGPHAELALRLAQAFASYHAAALTLLHVEVPRWSAERRKREGRFYEQVRRHVTYPRTEHVHIESDSVEEVLLERAAAHDLVVMGAAARDVSSPYLLGRIPEAIARNLETSLVVVKTREPVTERTFGDVRHPTAGGRSADISELVDRWFAENTFHSHEFRDLSYLVDLKERQGRTISLVLPTLNEEKTVGKIITTIKRQLVERFPLLDEILVIDSQSEDRTVEIATSLGVAVHQHAEILPQYGTFRGKGEGLWKGLYVSKGDIIVWIDSDITGIHPKFVYGLIGPLLTQPKLGFVKGFYRRPLNLGSQRLTTGGGRVTELTARPLINLFFPQLSGLVQPLAGEMAGTRAVLESIPFFTGYGVETGLLIDILHEFGLHSIAQTDLEERIHRNQSLLSLSNMAFAIVQVVIKRLGDRRRLELLEEMNTSMKLIHYAPSELFLEVKEIEEHERPPMKTVREYVERETMSSLLP
ncbi:MAG: glucosyl-3-phosphoglycerate synthase [Chloroflexota bacterium]